MRRLSRFDYCRSFSKCFQKHIFVSHWAGTKMFSYQARLLKTDLRRTDRDSHNIYIAKRFFCCLIIVQSIIYVTCNSHLYVWFGCWEGETSSEPVYKHFVQSFDEFWCFQCPQTLHWLCLWMRLLNCVMCGVQVDIWMKHGTEGGWTTIPQNLTRYHFISWYTLINTALS